MEEEITYADTTEYSNVTIQYNTQPSWTTVDHGRDWISTVDNRWGRMYTQDGYYVNEIYRPLENPTYGFVMAKVEMPEDDSVVDSEGIDEFLSQFKVKENS